MSELLKSHYHFGRYILEIILKKKNNDEESVEKLFSRYGIELGNNSDVQRKALSEELKANEKEQRYILRATNEPDQIIRALHTLELSLKNLDQLRSWVSEYEMNDESSRRNEEMPRSTFLQSRRNG